MVFTVAITKEHIRFSIHFAFHLKKNAAEATANYLYCIWREAEVILRVKDDINNFVKEISDEPRAGRPQKIETDELQA